jgi:hypothetical protein
MSCPFGAVRRIFASITPPISNRFSSRRNSSAMSNSSKIRPAIGLRRWEYDAPHLTQVYAENGTFIPFFAAKTRAIPAEPTYSCTSPASSAFLRRDLSFSLASTPLLK